VQDLHGFNTWNPWLKQEPGLKGQYSGPASGPGASYAWDGEKMGAGSMTVQTVSADKVTLQLDFLKPFEAHNLAEFTLQPAGDGTQVVWAMSGPSPYISKIMQVFFSMDKMIGKDFEAGLAGLRTLAEAK
jgi:hypothetical protein